jgi:hypothetical protein
MRRRIQVITAFGLALMCFSTAHSFGRAGHEIVGGIAEYYLCDNAREQITELLGDTSLGRASLWPDWIRREEAWRHTRPWHYINVPDHSTLEGNIAAKGGDILQAIERFYADLANPDLPRTERVNALRFLSHFIADVHQPLHVGRAEDRGGNSIRVRVDGKLTNLHAVWDAQGLLRRSRGTGPESGRLAALIELTADRLVRLQTSGPREWARESVELRDQVYSFDLQSPENAVILDAGYLAAATETLDIRLSEAGVRLAGVLNEIFCPAVNTETH